MSEPSSFDQADSSALASYDSSTAGSAAGECPVEENQCLQPCDADDVVVAFVPASFDTKYKEIRGEWEEVPDQDRGFSLYGSHGYPQRTSSVIQALSCWPNVGKATPGKIKVTLVPGSTGFCGGDHPKVLWKESGGQVIATRTGGDAEQNEWPVYRYWPPEGIGKAAKFLTLMSDLWPAAARTRDYYLEVSTCGLRDEGDPHVASRGYHVHVYPDAVYKLTVSIPAFRKSSYERSVTQKKDGSYESSESNTVKKGGQVQSAESSKVVLAGKDGGDTYTESSKTESYAGMTVTKAEKSGDVDGKEVHDRTWAITQGDKTTTTTMDVDKVVESKSAPVSKDGIGFKIERKTGDGSSFTCDVTDLVKKLKDYEQTFKDIWNTIKDFQPQVGWKFVFETSILTGTMELNWGLAPAAKDMQSLVWFVAGKINLELLSFCADLSFGIGVGKWVVARLYGKGTGAVNLECSGKTSGPVGDSNVPMEFVPGAKVENKVGLELGAEVVVSKGFGDPLLETQGAFKFEIVAQGEPRIEVLAGFYIEYKIVANPITISFKAGHAYSNAKTYTYEITEETKIGEGKLLADK